MLVELLLGLACERALWAGVRPLAPVVHLVLFQLPLGPKDLLADAALLRVLSVVDLQVETKSPELLEPFLALWTLEDAIDCGVDLEEEKIELILEA